MEFELNSEFKPTGDQPKAIEELVTGIEQGIKHQTLLGVTGSGKTFTAANVIQKINKPTLVLCHNKTLAAQLFSEFKQFFPNNLVEYFVSYYDYYQPEAYIPTTGVYIEKDLSINEEIEKYRLSTTSSLLSGRSDIIVVSSVSCIYGIGNPEDFHNGIIDISIKNSIKYSDLIKKLVSSLYSRTNEELKRGQFRIKGDTIDIFCGHNDICYRILFLGDEIEEIYSFCHNNGNIISNLEKIRLFPASIFLASKNKLNNSISQIEFDLEQEVKRFNLDGMVKEGNRLYERTKFDIEMIKELGYCSGIENYSRYLDGRKEGSRPFCLIDYFGNDFLTIVDESHVTIPQVKAMYGGDKSRKMNLVEHGFRLRSALDNRPLKFEEFENLNKQTIYVSATPAEYELDKSEGVIVEQVIRPTGLLDPIIEVRSSKNQIDDVLEEITFRIEKKERSLITTLTKKMAEEFSKYLQRFNIKCRYIHSDVDTIERIEIIKHLKKGTFDVLIGVNLLREGLDLPEVSLVAIIDADKEGFLRSERSLTQTSGRTARHINGKVIMYADKVTKSMKRTIDETNRRRKIQKKYNLQNNLTPSPIFKKEYESTSTISKKISNESKKTLKKYSYSEEKIKTLIKKTSIAMKRNAKELNFLEATKLREELSDLKKQLTQIKKNES